MRKTTQQRNVWCSKYVLFFFIISWNCFLKNPSDLLFYFLYLYKNKKKVMSALILWLWKNYAWNIRLFVDELFVTTTQPPSVLYQKLLDLISFQNNKFLNDRNDKNTNFAKSVKCQLAFCKITQLFIVLVFFCERISEIIERK